MAGRFRVSSFATVIAQLRESTVLVQFGPQEVSPDEVVNAALQEADQHFKELPLSVVLRSQWQRLLARADAKVPLSELVILIREMSNNLMVELSSAWFLMIPADRRFVYEQPKPIFGPDVDQAFSGARLDIAAAGRCYALDEWTACVFHTMRALEDPLLWLAARVQLEPGELQRENWKNILDLIEKKIRAMEKEPKSESKISKVQFLSEAATQFRWFKDAWRNNVAHGHVQYDERDGAPIFLHASDFFRHVAAEAVKENYREQ
jgi:hypothetical protein